MEKDADIKIGFFTEILKTNLVRGTYQAFYN